MTETVVDVVKKEKAQREFSVEIQYLKKGKFWVPVRTVVIPASTARQAVTKANQMVKALIPKGTRVPGLCIRVQPIDG